MAALQVGYGIRGRRGLRGAPFCCRIPFARSCPGRGLVGGWGWGLARNSPGAGACGLLPGLCIRGGGHRVLSKMWSRRAWSEGRPFRDLSLGALVIGGARAGMLMSRFRRGGERAGAVYIFIRFGCWNRFWSGWLFSPRGMKGVVESDQPEAGLHMMKWPCRYLLPAHAVT